MFKTRFEQDHEENDMEWQSEGSEDMEKRGGDKGKKKQKANWVGNCICFIFLGIFFLFLISSKLNEEAFNMFSRGNNGEEVDNYYEILGIDPSAS